MSAIRQAAVAGQFYPAGADELRATVQDLIDRVTGQPGPAPKALIAPHAGYIYSGPVAATAYASLRPFRDRYTRVVLLGPCHRVAVNGLALSGVDAFSTPLGEVPLDKRLIASLKSPDVEILETAHKFEHSLEVHLPFLQVVLESFSLVPLLVGDASPGVVAKVINSVWGGMETLIVVSSDLSHYLAYDEARAKDRLCCDAIEHFADSRISHSEACGATPVKGLLIEARNRGMEVTTLDLRNSGDTAGGRDRVVGYGSWVFTEVAA